MLEFGQVDRFYAESLVSKCLLNFLPKLLPVNAPMQPQQHAPVMLCNVADGPF